MRKERHALTVDQQRAFMPYLKITLYNLNFIVSLL